MATIAVAYAGVPFGMSASRPSVDPAYGCDPSGNAKMPPSLPTSQ